MRPGSGRSTSGRDEWRFATASPRQRRQADLFLADLLGRSPTRRRRPPLAVEAEDQGPPGGVPAAPKGTPSPGFDLLFIEQRLELGATAPDTARCAVVIPHGLTVADGKLDVILYLHGMKSPCGGKQHHTIEDLLRSPLFKAIPAAIADSGKNVILVAPTLGFSGEVGPGDNFVAAEPWRLLGAATARVATALGLSTLQLGQVILAGHSGAGARILRLLGRRDAALAQVIAVWALDATYSGRRVWRNAIDQHRSITWTIVRSNGGDAHDQAVNIEADNLESRRPNLKFMHPDYGHCNVPAHALLPLLQDEPRLGLRPAATTPRRAP